MKASTLCLNISLIALSTTTLAMHAPERELRWGDRVEAAERQKAIAEGTIKPTPKYTNNSTKKLLTKPVAQIANAKNEARALREEPARKSSSTTSAQYFPANRPTTQSAHVETNTIKDVDKKTVVLFELLPQMIEESKRQHELNAQTVNLCQQMFLTFDERFRALQIEHTQTLLNHQEASNQRFYQLSLAYNVLLAEKNALMKEIVAQQEAELKLLSQINMNTKPELQEQEKKPALVKK